jgi:phage shock protein A
VVEANLFARAVRVIQSYANQIGELNSRQAAQRAGSRAHTPTRRCCGAVRCGAVRVTVCARAALLLPAVSNAEDPEKLLDQVVNEMQEDLIKMRQASAQVR